MNTDSKNVHQRLAAAMAEVDYIQKEKKQGMNYTIVSHDAVTAKVRPVLLKNGIVYYPVRCEHIHNGNRAECAMTVRFVNIDAPTDFFDVPSFGYGIDTQDKGPGKAMSYAVKYALLKALGLETGDDPDTEDAPFVSKDVHQPAPKQTSAAEMKRGLEAITQDLLDCRSSADAQSVWKSWKDTMKAQNWTADYIDIARDRIQERGKQLKAAEDTFPGDMTPITDAVRNVLAG
jgi:hypothetical protein